MRPPRDPDNEESRDFEEDIDEEELEELNRSMASSTFLEQRWWRWLAVGAAALLVLALALPVLQPLLGNADPEPGPGEPAQQAADFILESPNHGTVRLWDEIDRNDYVVLVFYRTYRDQVCRSHLVELQEAYPELRAAGAEVLAISTDSMADARRMVAHARAEFPVLSDASAAVTQQYGLLDLFGDEVAAPATLIIDGRGVLLGGYVGDDPDDRLPASIILDFIRGGQRA